MKLAFPVVNKGASNEKLMEGLFFVLVLFQLPIWMEDRQPFLHFLLALAVGLVVDVAINLIRHKKPICAVSAAITAEVVYILLNRLPLQFILLGVAAAIILGKHIWGGTGKNPVNPALVGVFLVLLLHPVEMPLFTPSLLYLMAVLPALWFLRMRPFAGLSFMVGMVLSFAAGGVLSWEKLITDGVLFFGTVVLTDPTTVTHRPLYGSIFGLIAGFSAFLFPGDLIGMCAAVLLINVASRIVEETQKTVEYHRPLRIQKQVHRQGGSLDRAAERKPDLPCLPAHEILKRLQRNKVYGMGGAAFPTHVKINAVMTSQAADKHLIINAVECDPGLVHDRWLLENQMPEIELGVEILQRLISFKTITLAVKGVSKPQAGLGGLFKRNTSYREVKVQTGLCCREVPDDYPLGAERFLIREILHRELSPADRPASVGILVLNVQTLTAVFRAVVINEEITTRMLTVANLREHTGHVVTARLGEKVSEVLDRVYPGATVVFTGGGLMQGTIADNEAVITPEVNFIATGNIPKYKESVQCSRCGMCLVHCPARINVRRISELVDAGKMAEAKAFRPERCIRCGICSYLCPAGRKLSQRVNRARTPDLTQDNQ